MTARQYKPAETERLVEIEGFLKLINGFRETLNAEKRRIHKRAMNRAETDERQARKINDAFASGL